MGKLAAILLLLATATGLAQSNTAIMSGTQAQSMAGTKTVVGTLTTGSGGQIIATSGSATYATTSGSATLTGSAALSGSASLSGSAGQSSTSLTSGSATQAGSATLATIAQTATSAQTATLATIAQTATTAQLATLSTTSTNALRLAASVTNNVLTLTGTAGNTITANVLPTTTAITGTSALALTGTGGISFGSAATTVTFTGAGMAFNGAGSTLTMATGKTLTIGNTMTIAATDGSVVTLLNGTAASLSAITSEFVGTGGTLGLAIATSNYARTSGTNLTLGTGVLLGTGTGTGILQLTSGLSLSGSTLSTTGTFSSTVSVPLGNSLYVDAVNGSDSTGARGTTKPFLTIGAAKTAASVGDTIIVLSGTYNEANIAKNGVNLFFEGATVNYSGTASAIIDDSSTGDNAALVSRIGGNGALIAGGNKPVIKIANAASNVVITVPVIQQTTSAIAIAASAVYQTSGTLRLRAANVSATNTALYWEGGVGTLDCDYVYSAANYGVYAKNPASGANWFVNSQLIDAGFDGVILDASGTASTSARLWVGAQKIITHGLTGASSAVTQLGGVLYVTVQKIEAPLGASGVSLIYAGGGILYVTALKGEGGEGDFGNGALSLISGTSYIRIGELIDTGVTGALVQASGGEHNLSIGKLVKTGDYDAVAVSGGIVNLNQSLLDTTAATTHFPITLTGGTTRLNGVIALGATGKASITSNSARTVNSAGFFANNAISPNVTLGGAPIGYASPFGITSGTLNFTATVPAANGGAGSLTGILSATSGTTGTVFLGSGLAFTTGTLSATGGGTVTSVTGTGSANGHTLTGSGTSTATLTLGGSLTDIGVGSTGTNTSLSTPLITSGTLGGTMQTTGTLAGTLNQSGTIAANIVTSATGANTAPVITSAFDRNTGIAFTGGSNITLTTATNKRIVIGNGLALGNYIGICDPAGGYGTIDVYNGGGLRIGIGDPSGNTGDINFYNGAAMSSISNDFNLSAPSANAVLIKNNGRNGTTIERIASGGVTVTGTLAVSSTTQLGASGAAFTSILSGTASLDFPSTAAGTSSILFITVTGAAANDGVQLGLPATSGTVTGACFNPCVIATGTVAITMTNTMTVTAVDPPADTFRAVVWHK